MKNPMISLILLVFTACSCTSVKVQDANVRDQLTSAPTSVAEDSRDNISVFALLADPERFHGRTVHVVGFVSINSEGPLCILAPDLLSMDNLIVPNFINLDLSVCKHKQRLKTDEGPVICSLTGTIDARSRGPFNHPPMACTLRVSECESAVPIRRVPR